MTRIRRSPKLSLLAALLATATWQVTAWPPPAGAQMAKVEKAHLDFEPAPVSAVAGSVARRVARVIIDDGWHVNAPVPTLSYLIPTELTVELPAG